MKIVDDYQSFDPMIGELSASEYEEVDITRAAEQSSEALSNTNSVSSPRSMMQSLKFAEKQIITEDG